MEVVRQSLRHARRPAIVTDSQVLRHSDLATQALHVRRALLEQWGPRAADPAQLNVAITTSAAHSFASALFGSWMAGAVAVPVPPSHPDGAIEHILRDSRSEIVLCDEASVGRMRALHPRVLSVPPRSGFRFMSTPRLVEGAVDAIGRAKPRWRDEDPALILYTSGTTGRCVTPFALCVA
jgi:acyl-CoA synthetase (AMP-forming)/AMP-acid ligase II